MLHFLSNFSLGYPADNIFLRQWGIYLPSQGSPFPPSAIPDYERLVLSLVDGVWSADERQVLCCVECHQVDVYGCLWRKNASAVCLEEFIASHHTGAKWQREMEYMLAREVLKDEYVGVDSCGLEYKIEG